LTLVTGTYPVGIPIVASVTGNGTLSYQWYQSLDGTNTGGSSFGGTNGGQTNTLLFNPTTISTVYFYCVINSPGAVEVVSGVAAITIVSHAITTQPAANTTVTAGSITETLTVASNYSGASTPTYQWFSNSINSNTGGTAITGATSATFNIPTTLTAETYYYYAEVSASGTSPVTSNVAVVTVEAATSGNAGPAGASATWSLSGTTLTISGSGQMDGYGVEGPFIPWEIHRTSITTVIISEGITNIGGEAFRNHASLTSISIPSTVVGSIIGYTFEGCENLTSIILPANITSIGFWSFRNCTALTSMTFLGNPPIVDSAAFVNVPIANPAGATNGLTIYYPAGNAAWDTAINGTTAGAAGTFYGYPVSVSINGSSFQLFNIDLFEFFDDVDDENSESNNENESAASGSEPAATDLELEPAGVDNDLSVMDTEIVQSNPPIIPDKKPDDKSVDLPPDETPDEAN